MARISLGKDQPALEVEADAVVVVVPGPYKSPDNVTVATRQGHRAGWVRSGQKAAIPSKFEATIDDPRSDFIVHLWVRVTDRPEVDAVMIERRSLTDGTPVSADALRRVKVSSLLRMALQEVEQPSVINEDGTFSPVVDGRLDGRWGGPLVGPGRGRGRSMDAETLRQVAAIYRAALATGRPPTEAVRREMNASRTTAGRWVMQARTKGFLGPAIGRTGGERTEV